MTDRAGASPLDQLIIRLLVAAAAAVRAGNLDQAKATAEDVQLVDPANAQAASILAEVARRQRTPDEERALMTILFSDLVDSTVLAGQLEPEAMRDIFRLYREAAQQAVDRFGGFVLQYLGDGIVATFGYPVAHEDDARRAVHAGLALIDGVAAASEAALERHSVEPTARVGIHTGPVVVSGLDAEDVRERHSIVGVAPNLAARLQSEAEPGMVVVSDVTQELVRGHFDVRSLGLRQLKGIARDVEVFAVDGVRSVTGRLDATRLSRAGLHGRDQARDRLVGAWDEVGTGVGRVAVISGEAGIGKSRLAAELRDHAAGDGHDTVAGGCQPYYANVALWPISTLIERALGLDDESEDLRLDRLVDHLAEIGVDPAVAVPYLAPLIGVADPPGYTATIIDATARLQETLAALVRWVGRLGARHRRLFLIEDLHWADPTTLMLLGMLAADPPAGVLSLFTTRDADALPWLGGTIHLSLDRLDEDRAAELVDDLAGGSELSPEVRQSIIARSEGIPLFVEELTCSILDTGLPADETMPYRLQELMTGRLKTPAIDLRLAQVAATLGNEFDRDLLARVVGSDYDIEPGLDAMVGAAIIDRTDRADGTYRFRHALMRDAAYETQVLEVRRATHATVADALAGEGADAALLAHHFDLAGDPLRGVPQYITAAQEALGRGAHLEAIRMLTRAIEGTELLPEGEGRDITELTARMLRGLNVSSIQGYASFEVAEDHRRVEIIAARLGTNPVVVPSFIGIWAYWLTSGDHETATRIATRLEGLVDDPMLAVFRPEVQACSGYQAFFYGTLDEARALLETAYQGFAARSPGEVNPAFWPLPNDSVAVTTIALATIAALQGDPVAAAEWERVAYERVAAIGTDRGPFSHAFVDVYASFIRRIQNDDDAARKFGADAVAIGHEYGYTYWVMLGSLYQMGPTSDADADPVFVAACIDALRGIGHYAFLGSALASLAELHADAGDLERALDVIDDAMVTVDKTGEELHRPEILRRRVEYRRRLVGAEAGDARELDEAYRVAVAKDIHVISLRLAVDIARLPEDERPVGWRDTLAEARDRLPAESVSLEAANADDILAS
jgi:class 3 adenylate cyclase